MPGLLTLKTDLKSLKYGYDTPGGGDSGQPYIKTDINTVDSGFNRLRLTKFDDGLVRGGIVGTLNAAVTDTLRIGKFFIDFPKGPLFIVKQVGLQLSNPRVESTTQPTNKPTKGQGFFINSLNFISNTANKIENAVGPTRIYNLGINTLAQVPVNAIGGHIVRHGFLPNNDSSKYYENVIKVKNFQNDSNRLLDLTNNFNLGPWGSNKPGLNKKEQGVVNKLKGLASAGPYGAVAFGALNAVFNTNKELEIDNYIAGPGSVYGIGSTIIHRAMDSDTENKTKIDFAKAQSITFAGKTRDDKGNATEVAFGLDRLLGASNYASSSLSAFYFMPDNKAAISNNDNNIPINLNNNIASEKDKHGTNTLNQKNSYTIANAKASDVPLTDFIGVSNFSSSIYSLPNASLTDTSGINNSLDDRVPLVSDYTHKRNTNIPALNNKNDIAPDGPSTYPNIATGSFKYPLDLPNLVYGNGTSTYSNVNKVVDKLTSPNNVGIYTKLLNGQLNKERLPVSKNNPTYKNKLGDKVVINIPWNKATREVRVGSGRRDSLNLTPIFDDKAGSIDDIPGSTVAGLLKIPNADVQTINDLVKFRIQAIDTHSPTLAKWMIFRAYITDLSDTVDATWNGTKYAGRGDQFYIYEGFTRKMSVTFKVAALSRYEMEPMYQKLNYLMSNLMPDYSEKDGSQGILMKGSLMRMTIGNWIDGQLCILNSLSYKIPTDSPWEIGLNDEELILPHIVEVTLGFTPIGSQTRDKNELPRKEECVSNIAQNWNGATEREYIVPCEAPAPPPPPPPPPPDPDPLPDPDPIPQFNFVDPIKPIRDNTRIAGPGGLTSGMGTAGGF